MYMKHNKQFDIMMRGGCGTFTQYELWAILSHQNELGINTLLIQKSIDDKFICHVDNKTTFIYVNK